MREPLLYPLTRFFAQDGRDLPEFDVVESADVPEPCHALLVHHGDMTSRLEEFHGGSLVLEVLHWEQDANAYRREVLLRVAGSGLAVEYGAIEINLAAFAPELRDDVLAARQPLGGLLNAHGLAYRSEPRAFIRVAPSDAMKEVFGDAAARELYGRCNLLLGEDGTTLAHIVEVLRPHSPRINEAGSP